MWGIILVPLVILGIMLATIVGYCLLVFGRSRRASLLGLLLLLPLLSCLLIVVIGAILANRR